MISFLIRSPYRWKKHPVFWIGAEQLPESTWLLSWRPLLLTMLFVLGVWVLLISGHMLLTLRLQWTAFDLLNRQVLNDFGANALRLLAGLSIALSIVLDVKCMWSGIAAINGEKLTGRWDLLRVSALNLNSIVYAKQARARASVWRYGVILTGWRLAIIFLWLLTWFSDANNQLPVGHNVMFVFLVVLLVGGVAVCAVLEPFWRMESFVSLSVMISAYVQHIPTARLAALGALLAIWIFQMVTLVAASMLSVMFLLMILLPLIIVLLTIYGFYALVGVVATSRTIRHLAQDK